MTKLERQAIKLVSFSDEPMYQVTNNESYATLLFVKMADTYRYMGFIVYPDDTAKVLWFRTEDVTTHVVECDGLHFYLGNATEYVINKRNIGNEILMTKVTLDRLLRYQERIKQMDAEELNANNLH